MRSVIFDLDGTLADTAADLIAAANHCFRGLGHGDLLDPAADAGTAFRGGKAMLRLGFGRAGGAWDEGDVDAQFPLLLEAYERDIDVHSRMYPGAVAAVERLRAMGIATGICTNKPEALAELLMSRLGVRGLFDSLVGADTLATRKPDPAPLREAIRRAGSVQERSILVGDTLTDRKTGEAAGVPVALITFGPDGRGVEDLKPEALLDDFGDLIDLVERMLPA